MLFGSVHYTVLCCGHAVIDCLTYTLHVMVFKIRIAACVCGGCGLYRDARLIPLLLIGTDPEDVIRNAFACFDEEGTGQIHEDR